MPKEYQMLGTWGEHRLKNNNSACRVYNQKGELIATKEQRLTLTWKEQMAQVQEFLNKISARR